MQLIDTHCHIHSDRYELDADDALGQAVAAGVGQVICVGTDVDDSKRAATFATHRKMCHASIGIHPHDSKKELDRAPELDQILTEDIGKAVVAIGEIGLDFYYNHSPKNEQVEALHYQINLAHQHDLPIIFHVRDAFDEFWKVFDQYKNLRGVVHSFSASRVELEQILARNLLVGLNGIMTFTTRVEQLDAARFVPLSSMILETDAPFLTPTPHRGKVNSPHFLGHTAAFLAEMRGESIQDLAAQTTKNAQKLFKI